MNRVSRRGTWMAGVILCLSSSRAMGATIRVPADLPTIQSGINAAAAGDVVLIAPGTYYEHDIVMRQGVCVTSEAGVSSSVKIDARGLGRVFYFENLDSSTSLLGLTITNGHAMGNAPGGEGGGISCVSASPTIRDCCITWNRADYGGGGLCCWNASCPIVTDCYFGNNTAADKGGALRCSTDSSPTVVRCTFVQNQSAGDGGGAWCYWYSDPVFIECRFEANHAGHDGGALYCGKYASPEVTGCLLSSNQGVHYMGGAINYSNWTSVQLSHCTIYGNSGFAIFVRGYGTDVDVSHCLIVWNGTLCPVAVNSGNSADFVCTDMYGHADDSHAYDWDCTIPAGQQGINGNLSADPLFCNAAGGDFRVYEGSPCAPQNNTCGLLIGAYGVGCSPTAVESRSWGAIKSLFR